MEIQNRQKEVLLFIHGFGSSPKCWDHLIKLLESDERISSRYEICTWGYPTKWVNMNLFGRIPRLVEIGKALRDEIESPLYRNRKLTLIGHSQGGLVIQSYFSSILEKGKAPLLSQIRQAIFIATPNKGSTTGINLRLFFSTFFSNPQEATLRVLNPDVADIRSKIRQQIVNATQDKDYEWRVPIHAICALEDNIVPEASARGYFDSVKRVPGTHFTVIKPEDCKDKRYTELAELLLEPGGHTHRYDIEFYKTAIRIEPREKQTITTQNSNPRTVEFDNYATITRTVKFAPGNRCRKKFSVRYGTQRDGYVVLHSSHKNEAAPNNLGLWEIHGTFCQFDLTPDNGQEYRVKVEIYKGFDEGNREVHFHLLNDSHYRRLQYELDLSAYFDSGYDVNREPVFYLFEKDVEHGEFCSRRKFGKCIPPMPTTTTSPGLYKWEVNDIYEGVIDITWDVQKKIHQQPVRYGS